MTQVQITTFIATGSVPCCSRCTRMPKHFLDRRSVHAGGGHFLECPACDNRTGRNATPAMANNEWCVRNGYAPRVGARSLVSMISARGRS